MKIIDVGAMFGYDCAQIFGNQKHTVIEELDHTKAYEDQLKDADLVIFGGGDDVNPAIYGHSNVASGSPNTRRDDIEMAIFHASKKVARVRRLGICRGAQFLCAMNGGWLVQHVDNHAGCTHDVHLGGFYSPDGKRVVQMNSYHHQMMVPNQNHSIIGWTENRTSEFLYDVKKVGLMPRQGLDPEHNAEIVLFSNRDLGVQAHPEYLPPDTEMPRLVRYICEQYLNLYGEG